MDEKFDPVFSSAFEKIDKHSEFEVWSDGMVCIEILGRDGTETAYTSLDELEAFLKKAREWQTLRKLAEDAYRDFHEDDYTNGL